MRRFIWLGQKVAAAAKLLAIGEQTMANWVMAKKAGQLGGVKSEPVRAVGMESNRLWAELARVTMEPEIPHRTDEDFPWGPSSERDGLVGGGSRGVRDGAGVICAASSQITPPNQAVDAGCAESP